jgi:hypothetical protein
MLTPAPLLPLPLVFELLAVVLASLVPRPLPFRADDSFPSLACAKLAIEPNGIGAETEYIDAPEPTYIDDPPPLLGACEGLSEARVDATAVGLDCFLWTGECAGSSAANIELTAATFTGGLFFAAARSYSFSLSLCSLSLSLFSLSLSLSLSLCSRSSRSRLRSFAMPSCGVIGV